MVCLGSENCRHDPVGFAGLTGIGARLAQVSTLDGRNLYKSGQKLMRHPIPAYEKREYVWPIKCAGLKLEGEGIGRGKN